MGHWSADYIGQPYNQDTQNCAHLARSVQRSVFNREIDIPVEYLEDLDQRTDKITDIREVLCEQVDAPQDGDLALLTCRGRPTHIAVVCIINGKRFFLHGINKHGVCLHEERRLAFIQMKIDSYWKLKNA